MGCCDWTALRRRSAAAGSVLSLRCACVVSCPWLALAANARMRPSQLHVARSLPLFQEYTTKLAALQGKGDEYEAAAAQVRA